MKSSTLSSLCLILALALAACGPSALVIQNGGTPLALVSSGTLSLPTPATHTPFQPLPPTETWLPSSTSTFTPSPTLTPTPTLTSAPLPTDTPTPGWSQYDAGPLDVPILLYHHVNDSYSLYSVSPGDFRAQMERLQKWNYTPITITQLARTIRHGGRLPHRPVVITFDDGYLDVYENAFPVMQELGFVGVFYLVSSQIADGVFVTPRQLKKMIAAGWEIGNHSATHPDLTAGYSSWLVQREVIQSRLDLQELLGIKINTFSYPFGLSSLALRQQVKDLEYLAAVSVEPTWEHSEETLYNLGRLEVRGYFSLDDFAALLPWKGK